MSVSTVKFNEPNFESEPMRFEHDGEVLPCYHIGRVSTKEIYFVKGGGYLVFEKGVVHTGGAIDEEGNICEKKIKKKVKEDGK